MFFLFFPVTGKNPVEKMHAGFKHKKFRCRSVPVVSFFSSFHGQEAVDELEEMHMKVLSEMTDETTKSVATVEVR